MSPYPTSAEVTDLLSADLADRYANLPTFPTHAVTVAWTKLGQYLDQQADHIASLIDVVRTQEPEPYEDASAMFEDIRRNRRLLVSEANSEHPVWSVDRNVSFRTYHDFVGHFLGGWSFKPQGEVNAYIDCANHIIAHTSHNDWPLMVEALFCESIGQLAYAVQHGDFLSPQRVGFLRGVL